MSFQCYHSACRYVGKTRGATPAQGGGPALQPATLTPNQCYPSRTLRKAEGGGGNETPHASSKSADGKAGHLGEPYFQPEQTDCPNVCQEPQRPMQQPRVTRCRGLAATFVLRPLELCSLCRICQRHSTKSVPSVPVSKE